MGKNNARMPNIEALLQAGIDPKTGLPKKMCDNTSLKTDIKKTLRVLDEQDAIHRYVWYNLPKGLNQELIERILYYRGQGMFFYMKENNKFYFLPYALSKDIDVYGRYTGVTPVPFNGSTGGKDKPWIVGLNRTPVYEALAEEEIDLDIFDNSCVLLSDYCKQYSQTNIPRKDLNEPILDVMSDCIPYCRTALKNSTGIQAMRVNNQDEQSNVLSANAVIDQAAISGEKFVPVIGDIDFQSLTEGNVANADQFMLTMQSLDNYRLSLYGLENGGLFEKKAHILQSENAINSTRARRAYEDGLTLRQEFCILVNCIWRLGIWCEPSETVIGDMDGDGKAYDKEAPNV